MNQLAKLDVNQITKTVYDPTTASLMIVPAYVDCASLSLSSPIYMAPYKTMGVMVNWKDTKDGALQFWGSIDGKLYKEIGKPFPLTESGHQDFGLVDEPYCYIKLESSNTSGTVEAVYMLRA